MVTPTNHRASGPSPILTAHLFPKVEAKLLELLRALLPDEWFRQTVSPQWKVKDVVAHLLDTQLRKLSMVRDRHVGERVEIRSATELVAYVNRLNEEGVRFYGRLSPAVLISMMEKASDESAKYHQALDPFAPAAFPVSWAGEQTSPNWFDTAREYTERWHHQQQIRLAVNRPGIMTRQLYHPVLNCFMRGLPHAYRDLRANPGTLLQFEVTGECGGTWNLEREAEAWRLVDNPITAPVARVTIPQEIAWRIFTKGIDREAAAAQVGVAGNSRLGLHVLGMITIVG